MPRRSSLSYAMGGRDDGRKGDESGGFLLL
jgi:hypothetical protein